MLLDKIKKKKNMTTIIKLTERKGILNERRNKLIDRLSE